MEARRAQRGPRRHNGGSKECGLDAGVAVHGACASVTYAINAGTTAMARPVGRPSLPYETRHVMLNIRTEYYVKLKSEGTNMSLLVNDFLHALHEYTVCPLCYSTDVFVPRCAKCDGRALFCQNPSCTSRGRGKQSECKKDPETMTVCTQAEFKGE